MCINVLTVSAESIDYKEAAGKLKDFFMGLSFPTRVCLYIAAAALLLLVLLFILSKANRVKTKTDHKDSLTGLGTRKGIKGFYEYRINTYLTHYCMAYISLDIKAAEKCIDKKNFDEMQKSVANMIDDWAEEYMHLSERDCMRSEKKTRNLMSLLPMQNSAMSEHLKVKPTCVYALPSF